MADRGLSAEAQQVMLARIAQRRQQLDAKMRAKRTAAAGGHQSDATKSDAADGAGHGALGKGEAQIRASRRELNALKAAAAEAVTRVRVATETQENVRRLAHEGVAEARLDRITEEATTSKKDNDAIQMCFDHLHEQELPQQLFRELTKQQEACKRVIDVKDKLIGELRMQLKDKEEDYVKALKRQAAELDKLIETMHTQTTVMAVAYGRELDAIESAYSQERRELLDANAQEISSIIQERESEENNLFKERAAKVWSDQKILDEKFEENAEKYNKCKMEMQHEINGLSQTLEKLRAKYILNMERLNYNLQVLRERCKENKKAIDLHKRKISKLHEIMSTLIAKYADTDRKFKQMNGELTESYRRVTEQYKDLQLKFQHFEKADADKFDAVWRMHEEENMSLVHKSLQGDRAVFEEMLGVAWAPPSLDFWAASHVDTAAADLAVDADHEDEQAIEEQKLELGEMGEAMLQLLYSQLPFLVEERIRKAITDLDESDAVHIKVESLLAALNIKQTADVQRMLDCFVAQTEDGQGALIAPQEAALALQRFLQERNLARDSTMKLNLSALTTSASGATKTTKKDAAALRRRQERDYWERMASIVPDNHLRLWTAVESGLEKYLKQLQIRQKLIDETDSIRRQNDELRTLLNQYLSSKLNEELFAPPQLQVVGSATGAGGHAQSM